MAEFAELVGIPKGTLAPYVTSNTGKARALGGSVGQRPHLTEKESRFVADNIRRADRANDGLSKQKCVDLVQEVKPELRRSQCEQALATVRACHRAELTGIVKAQATTTKRSAITVTQQYRWHTTYESVLDELRRHNTGLCKHTGKTFGEVIDHFVVGGDETCLLASGGSVHIIGDKDKKKHELKSAGWAAVGV